MVMSAMLAFECVKFCHWGQITKNDFKEFDSSTIFQVSDHVTYVLFDDIQIRFTPEMLYNV